MTTIPGKISGLYSISRSTEFVWVYSIGTKNIHYIHIPCYPHAMRMRTYAYARSPVHVLVRLDLY